MTHTPLDHSSFIARHRHDRSTALAIDDPVPVKTKPHPWVALTSLLVFFALACVFGTLVYWLYVPNVAGFSAQTPPFYASVAGCIITIIAGVLMSVTIYGRGQRLHFYALMQDVLEGSRGARFVTDPHLKTLYYNKKFERLCRGVGPANLQTLKRLFEGCLGCEETFARLASQAQKGEAETTEFLSRHEDTERWFRIIAQPVSGHAQTVHWRVDDITKKHIADRAIREEREKLIDFTDNAPVGFFSLDQEGRFLFANATFARWLGEDLQSLLGHARLHTYLISPPEKVRPYDLTEDQSSRQVVELKMKGPGGTPFLASINQIVVHEDDETVRTRAVVRDLTSERAMRKALEASEDRFQRFFEDAPLGIVRLDDARMIIDCNEAFARMMRAEISDIEQSPFPEWLDAGALQKAMAEIARVSEGGESNPVEIALATKKGRVVTTQMYARDFTGTQGTVLHFIDVTEKKSLEAQFVQSQKMQAIGQLAGGVAHDFNNLLTAIIGYCDLLQLRHKPGDPSFADIKQVEQNAQRAAALVRQLLAFSRQQTLQPKLHDITDILTEVSHLLRRLIGVSIDLDLVHGQELALVKVDERQMEQVLINLAVNARDAMGGAGRLTVETEAFENIDTIDLVSEELPSGQWVRITVEDTGSGISDEHLGRIFEPFFTTKKVGEGTGLGLATVYGIVRQTGGFLDVKSVLGEGTRFIIYLPQASEADVEAAESVVDGVEEQPADLTGSARILLVEDEDSVRTFSERALVNKGYEVIAAESAEVAWEMFEAGDIKRIDLMVTDVVMPGMDGPTLVRNMRKTVADLKVIFMSGYTEDKLKDEEGGEIHFLPKPFTLKALAAKVKDVLDG